LKGCCLGSTIPSTQSTPTIIYKKFTIFYDLTVKDSRKICFNLVLKWQPEVNLPGNVHLLDVLELPIMWNNTMGNE
jgi:hypothetical protein